MSDEKSVLENKSFLDSIINFAANLGTEKDKRSYSRWGGGRGSSYSNSYTNRSGIYGSLSQNRVQLEEMYSEDWLCGKVIDIPIEDMLRQWRTVDFGGNNEMKELFEEAEKHFALREHLEDALKWADLYGGSVIVLGVDNCGHCSTPLFKKSVPKNGLKFLRPLDRWYVTPQTINYYDINQPNFFKPNFYRLSGTSQLLHHSRVVRFDGVKMPRGVSQLNWTWGLSKLERLQDALLNAASAPNIIASLMLECNFPVISVDNLASILSSPNGEQKIKSRMALATLFKSMFNMTLLDSKESYDLKSPAIEGLNIFADMFHQIVAGGVDIPVTRLMGIVPGGLNASGDTELINYYDGLKSKQQTKIRPALDKIDEIILMSTFGFIPKKFTWEFNPLWQMSTKDQADAQLVQAQRDAIYLQNNVLPPDVVAAELQKNDTYKNITPDLIASVGDNFVNTNADQQDQSGAGSF